MARLSGSTDLFRRHTNVAQYRFFPVDCHIYGMASELVRQWHRKSTTNPSGYPDQGLSGRDLLTAAAAD